MFVTPLNIEQVLDRFYNQFKYDLMLLFVSSFDGNDRAILKEIVDNAKRIDRITGNRICFFYFIKDSYGCMNESLTRWVKNISNWEPLYGEGVSVTMETADDICRRFGILRSNLPAFILVGKDRQEEPLIFSIHDYQDLESFLTPLNILHSYIEDKEYILFRYQQDLQKYQNQIKRREKWTNTLRELEAKREELVVLGMAEQTKDCNLGIEKLRERLRESPLQPSEENKERDLILLENKTIDRLNMSLNSQIGKSIVEQIQYRYASVVLEIFNLVGTRGIRLSNILSRIRTEIYERGFDVFISCKSQDYGLAHDLYNFLINNGFKPFLADSSIKEVGIDQYTALIGEVINVCQYMVVFATDTRYLETPYVAAEWHTFINDVNTGHKPNAKLVNILAPNIDVHYLPAWLRDKQCFTTENYKDGLLNFLKGEGNSRVQQLREKIQDAYYNYIGKRNQLYSTYKYQKLERWYRDFIYHIERDKERIHYMLKETENSYNYRDFEFLQMKTNSILERWEDEYSKIVNAIKELQEDEESQWHKAVQIDSEEALKQFLELFPDGMYAKEARIRLNYYLSSASKEKVIALDDYSCSSEFDVSDINSDGAIEDAIDKDCLSPEFQDVLSDDVECVCADTDTFEPNVHQTKSKDESISSMWKRLFKRRESSYDVFSSIFAPAEVKRKSHMLVQVYLHLHEETEKVKSLSLESDKDAERCDYIPLQCKLKKRDKVDVLLNIYGETLLMSEKKSVIWQGTFTKCSFDYFVPKDIDVDDLNCVAMLTVNGIPVGEMRFITRIVDAPRQLNPEIIAQNYNKVFISYSHLDSANVEYIAKAYKALGVKYFFDSDQLEGGDVFEEVIMKNIDSSDLFILCWSDNAAKSNFIPKEIDRALIHAYPQKPLDEATLKIFPISIEPRAELPSVMANCYHFEVIGYIQNTDTI